jgi:hypothetical protein
MIKYREEFECKGRGEGKNDKRERNGSQRGDTKRKEKESLATSFMLIADKN